MNPGQKHIFATPICDKFNPASQRSAKNSISRLIIILVFFFFVSRLAFDVSPVYSQQPTQEWVVRYNDNGSNAFGISIKPDSLGNVYVLTHQAGTAPGSYYGLLKYTPSGSLVWNVSYDFDTTTDGNVPAAFDVTPTGDAYITGNGGTVSTNSIVTLKFNSGGIFQWARVISTADGNDIKIDKQGYAIVAGDIKDGSVWDSYIVKYKPNGDTLFTRKFRPALNSAEFVKVLLDNSSNIYGCGDVSADYLAVKYDSSGNFIWYTTWTSTPNYQDYVRAAAIDSLKSVYLVGSTTHPYSGGFSNNLIKISTSGTVTWTKEFVGVLGDTGCGIPSGIGVTPEGGSIYYTTTSNILSPEFTDIVTLKYGSTGDSVWVRRYSGGNVPGGFNQPFSLRLDKYGYVYIAGTGQYQISGNDYVTLKYSPAGVQQWAITYNGPLTNSDDDLSDLFIDTNLNIYVTGTSSRQNSPTFLWDVASIKYSQPNGVEQISTDLPGSFKLEQNYPNPFNSITMFHYEVLRKSNIRISIYNVIGQLVRNLVNTEQQAGKYRVELDAGDLASGIYFYTLFADNNKIDSKKLVLIK